MRRKFFFCSCISTLAIPLLAITSCQQGQDQNNNLVYGQDIKCQTRQEIDALFKNNITKWPKNEKVVWSQDQVASLNTSLDKNVYFDLVASICCSDTQQIFGNFVLESWDASNYQIAKLVLANVTYNEVKVQYEVSNGCVVLSLPNKNSPGLKIPSFAYQYVSIEG